jgi:tetratricopeptide (TPR) repeat protein
VFTPTELRAALTAAGLVVDDGDDLSLSFGGDGPYFDMQLAIVNGDVVASIEAAPLPLAAAARSRVRRWLDERDIGGELGQDADGDTVISFLAGLDKPTLDEVPGWIDEVAASVDEVLCQLADHMDAPDEELAFLTEAIELNEAGRPAEALAALERLAADPSGRSIRARGCHLGVLGDLLSQVGRTAEATPVLTEAVELLTAAGEEHLAALTELDLVSTDLTTGQYRAGLARCDRLAPVLERVGVASDLDYVATLRGQLLVAMDEYDDALDVLAPLERRLSHAPDSPHLATARLALGACMGATGNLDGALEMLTSAQRLFEEANQVLDAARCMVNRAGTLIKAERIDDALPVIGKARAVLEPIGALDQLAGLDTCEALVHRARGDTARADALMQRASDELAAAHADGTHEGALALANLGAVAYDAGDFPAAVAACERAEERFRDLGLPVQLARVRHNLALARMASAALDGQIDPEQAGRILSDAAAAVEAIEDARQDFAAVVDRGRWAAETGGIFALAAGINHAFGQHRQVIELLERARAQGLPDLDATDVAAGRHGLLPVGRTHDDPGTGAESVADPDEAPADATSAWPDDGESRTLDAVRSALQDLSVASPEAVDVASVTHAAGGPFAWRWVLWRVSGLVIWAVVDGRGRAHSGVVAVDGPRRDLAGLPIDASMVARGLEPIGPELDRLGRAQGLGTTDPVMRALTLQRGLLVEDPEDDEPQVAWELGRKLVPPVLADELRRRAARGADPLPLVIAPSPGLARVAFGLLAIEAPSDELPTGRRLVEAAIVTMAAPSALVQQRARAMRRAAPPLDVSIAVVNPTGDLKHTVPVVDCHPEGCAGVGARFGGDENACTRDRLLDALRAVTAGGPGVLYWDGHAEPGPDGRPLDAGWPLTRHVDGTPGEGLSVEDLLRGELHVPSRAVLFGCTTMGVDEGLSEWWGFPVALLYAGASSVVASTWDLFDCPASALFAADVLRLAIEADDLATGLRELQMRWLHDWRNRRAGDRSLGFDGDDRHPHIWAGWSVVGLHYG